MIRLTVTENVKLGIVATVTLISIGFWSFKLVSEDQFNVLRFAACLLLVAIVIHKTKIFVQQGLRFKTNVLLFLLLPLLSVVGASLYHNQPMGLSLMLLRLNLFWLFYFVLHIFNISAEKILKLLIFIGCIWAFLTIVQQFTYPIAFFYSREEDNAGFLRGDLVRLMPAGQGYGVFVLLYFFYKYLTTKKVFNLLFVGFILCGLYFYGTRQGLAVAVGCMLVAVLLLKDFTKWIYLVLFSVMAFIVIIVIRPPMITHYFELTSEQMDNEDYIRFLAFDFYLNEYWPHWGAKLLGNGKPHLSTDYGLEMRYISVDLGLWRSDVGIVGAYNTYGLFYVINILWVNIKGMFSKFTSEKHKYLRLLFFFPTFLLPLNVGYTFGSVICFYCLVFYLMDKSFQEEDEKKNIYSNKLSFRKKMAEAAL